MGSSSLKTMPRAERSNPGMKWKDLLTQFVGPLNAKNSKTSSLTRTVWQCRRPSTTPSSGLRRIAMRKQTLMTQRSKSWRQWFIQSCGRSTSKAVTPLVATCPTHRMPALRHQIQTPSSPKHESQALLVVVLHVVLPAVFYVGVYSGVQVCTARNIRVLEIFACRRFGQTAAMKILSGKDFALIVK